MYKIQYFVLIQDWKIALDSSADLLLSIEV